MTRSARFTLASCTLVCTVCFSHDAFAKPTLSTIVAETQGSSQVVEAAAQGHRTFLLADEPGTGKTIMAGLYIREMQRVGPARRSR